MTLESYIDSFGNRCNRFLAQQGPLRLSNSTLIHDSGLPEARELSTRAKCPSTNCRTSHAALISTTAVIAKSTAYP